MKAKFQQVVALGGALVGSADAYDRWAQQEQARVLIEYAQQQPGHREFPLSARAAAGTAAK
jgi:hypothetical protein